MPFVRVKTKQEEREMDFTPAYAIEVSQDSIPTLIKATHSIPKYLKRVKKADAVLLLIGLGAPTDTKYTGVLVPAFQPTTREQFNAANAVWPCYLYQPYIEKINQGVVDAMVDAMLGVIHGGADIPADDYCTGICLIFDGCDLISHKVDTNFYTHHAVCDAISEVSQSKRGYLCTGLTALVLREPCASCAMAFVHGRISRVFVVRKRAGGPYSELKLNYNENLNHRYTVYVYKEKPPCLE